MAFFFCLLVALLHPKECRRMEILEGDAPQFSRRHFGRGSTSFSRAKKRPTGKNNLDREMEEITSGNSAAIEDHHQKYQEVNQLDN